MNANVPPSCTPKTLLRQATEKAVFQIVRNIQPLLFQYFLDVDFSNRVEQKQTLIEAIRKLKSQYWDDVRGIREPYRRYISNAMTEAMEDELFIKHDIKYRNPNKNLCLALVLFAAQILFTYNAGVSFLLSNFKLIVIRDKRMEMLSVFISALIPFHLEIFSTAHFKLDDSNLVITIIENSPNLKAIYLVHNICSSVMDTLRTHSRSIEEVFIKLFSYIHREHTLGAEFLFKTFFGNLNMKYVMCNVDHKEKILLSFPVLKKVCIRNNNCNSTIPVSDFMFCLQHLYPNIKTNWSKFVNVTCPKSMIEQSEFALPPPFRENVKHHWDIIEVGLINGMKELKSGAYEQEVVFPRCNHINYEIDADIDSNCKKIIEELTRIHECDSLGFILYKGGLNSNSNTTLLKDIGNNLRKLNLVTTCQFLGSELFEALNACPVLELLILRTPMIVDDTSTVILNSFSKLTVLQLDIDSKYEITDNSVTTLQQRLMTAAPQVMELYIKKISNVELGNMLSLGYLSNVQVLHLASPFPTNLVYFTKQLQSLSLLVINSLDCSPVYYSELKKQFHYTDLKIYCDMHFTEKEQLLY